MTGPWHSIYEAQDFWLEHFRFGQPEEPSSKRYKYAWEFTNGERSKLLEHTMDVVRGLTRDTIPDPGYVGEKLWRIENNYLENYDRPGYWRDYCSLTGRDKEILEIFTRIEDEKMRGMYGMIDDPSIRKGVEDCMDFVIEVASPICYLNKLRSKFERCKTSANIALKEHSFHRYNWTKGKW